MMSWTGLPARQDNAAPAQVPHPRSYACPRAAQAPRIDGRLDDECWRTNQWTEAFVDIEGSVKPKPRFATQTKMTWDDGYFYIGARLEEPHVWGTLTEHDAVIFRDNDFEVFVDPDGDNHNYFEFEINALNTGWDLFLNRAYQAGGKADNSWEIPGLRTAVRVEGTLNDPSDTDSGWTVEMAFPWKAFERSAGTRLPPREGDRWRVNFSRVEWQARAANGKYEKLPGRREDNWVWSPQYAINMHRPEMWGYVQFGSVDAAGKAPDQDPLWPVKARLHAVNDAQREFRRKTGRHARTLDELGAGQSGVTLRTSATGFELRLPPCTLDETSLLRCEGR